MSLHTDTLNIRGAHLLSHGPQPAGPVLGLLQHRGELRVLTVLESKRSSDNLLQMKNTHVPQRTVQGRRTLPLVKRGKLLAGSVKAEQTKMNIVINVRTSE